VIYLTLSNAFYLTTAIPYVNAAPHIGHTFEFVQTDVIARYKKLRGMEVALVTGADENSLKNVQAAEKQGITVAQLCDSNAEIFRQMASKVHLSFTGFQRTSNKKTHWPGVQNLWSLCDKSGDIYKKKYRGLYCVGCEAFYEESELSDGFCPEHNKKPEIIEEENYFFRLSKYQDTLEKLIDTGELRIIPETRKNEVLSFIRGGLRDFSVSRSMARAKGWGVPVPNDPTQIQYVWFDALGTYITGIGYGTNEEMFKKFWPASVHVIGKGILRFHAVYWPAMLLSAGLKLPKVVFVHGYITAEGQKMSKSLGNIVDPFYLIEKYGVDPVRYCLLSEIPTFDDGDFSEKILVEKNNNELLANLGNLVNRVLVFTLNNFDGKVPEGKISDLDNEFISSQNKLRGDVSCLLDGFKLKEALQEIMVYSKNGNRYFQDNKPWELVKNNPGRAAAVLNILIHQVRDLAIMIEPFLPATSKGIFEQLNLPAQNWAEVGKMSIKKGHLLGKPKVLFTKFDQPAIKTENTEKTMFSDLDIEVGEILSVDRHPNAEKLYVEKIRFGDGERQIVSGLVNYYPAEKLKGMKVLVLKNLAPAKLRGVESQGMVLVAETSGDLLEIFDCKDFNVGDKLNKGGENQNPKPHLSIKEFGKVPMEVKGYVLCSEGKFLTVNGKQIKTRIVKDGSVA